MLNDNIDPAHGLLQALIAPWRAQCLYVAARLDLAGLIGQGVDDLPDLAHHLGIPEDRLGRLLRFLVASGTFSQHPDGQYANTATSSLLRDGEGSLRHMVLLYGREMYQCWQRLYEALDSSHSGFKLTHGQDFYPYLAQQPDSSLSFQHTLRSRREIFEEVPKLFDFTGACCIDVGAGNGELSRLILEATPSARSLMLDLAPALEAAADNVGSLIDSGRARLCARDMFAELPGNADVYLLSRVLGDLDDSAATRLLRNCRQAMSQGCHLLIIEQLVRATRPSELSTLWDLHLFLVCQGQQRTQADFERLLLDVGLRIERHAELPLDMSLLVVCPLAEGLS